MAYKLSVNTAYIWIEPVLTHPLFTEELESLRLHEANLKSGSISSGSGISDADLRYLSHTRHVLVIVRATRAFHIIDRTNGKLIMYRRSFAKASHEEVSFSLPLPDAKAAVTYIDGLLGLVHLIQGYYLVIAVASTHVASLHGRSVRRITHTQLLSISPNRMEKNLMGISSVIAEEERNCIGFTSVLDKQHLYFSYSGDIMLPSQKLHDFVDVYRNVLSDSIRRGSPTGSHEADSAKDSNLTTITQGSIAQTAKEIPVTSVAIELFPTFAPTLRTLLASEYLSRSDDRNFYNRSHVALLYHAYVSTYERNNPPRPVLPWAAEPSPLAPFALRAISGFVGEFIIKVPEGVKVKVPKQIAERLENKKSNTTTTVTGTESDFIHKEGIKELSIVLIARRSRYREGPRLMTRGIDARGHAGNFVEIETVLQGYATESGKEEEEKKNKSQEKKTTDTNVLINSQSMAAKPEPLRVPIFVSSFCQTRGSVPLEFRQSPDMSFFTSPPITFPTFATRSDNPGELFAPTVPPSSTYWHLNSLRETYFPPRHPHKLTVLSLLNRNHGDERDLGLALALAVRRGNVITQNSNAFPGCKAPKEVVDSMVKFVQTWKPEDNIDAIEAATRKVTSDITIKAKNSEFHGACKFYANTLLVSNKVTPYYINYDDVSFSPADAADNAVRLVNADWNGTDPLMNLSKSVEIHLRDLALSKPKYAYLLSLLALENGFFLTFNNSEFAVTPSLARFPNIPGVLAHTTEAASCILKSSVSVGENAPIVDPHKTHAAEGSLLVERQTGLVRVNCVDCIDRSNQAQLLLSGLSLQLQLKSLGVLSNKEVCDALSSCHTRLWQDAGDAIAWMVAGTESMTKLPFYPLPSIAKPVMGTIVPFPTSHLLRSPSMLQREGRSVSLYSLILHRLPISLKRRWIDNFEFGTNVDNAALFSTCYRPGQRYMPFQQKEIVEDTVKTTSESPQHPSAPKHLVVRQIQDCDRPHTISFLTLAAFAFLFSSLLWAALFFLKPTIPIPFSSWFLLSVIPKTILGLTPELTKVTRISQNGNKTTFTTEEVLSSYVLSPGSMGVLYYLIWIFLTFWFFFACSILFSGNGLLDHPYLSPRIKAAEFDFAAPNYSGGLQRSSEEDEKAKGESSSTAHQNSPTLPNVNSKAK